MIKDAANELRYHLEHATGAKLPIIGEQEWNAIPNRNESTIQVGPTSHAKSAGIDVGRMSPNGFVMRTIGNQLFLLGKDGGEDTPTQQTQVLRQVREAFDPSALAPLDWWRELGPLSDRYARYLIAVQNEAILYSNIAYTTFCENQSWGP